MSKKKSATKDLLRELCIAHSHLLTARQNQEKEGEKSPIVDEMYQTKIRELEVEIAHNLKTWLGIDESQNSTKTIIKSGNPV